MPAASSEQVPFSHGVMPLGTSGCKNTRDRDAPWSLSQDLWTAAWDPECHAVVWDPEFCLIFLNSWKDKSQESCL